LPGAIRRRLEPGEAARVYLPIRLPWWYYSGLGVAGLFLALMGAMLGLGAWSLIAIPMPALLVAWWTRGKGLYFTDRKVVQYLGLAGTTALPLSRVTRLEHSRAAATLSTLSNVEVWTVDGHQALRAAVKAPPAALADLCGYVNTYSVRSGGGQPPARLTVLPA
jgi:hypothetical protein